MHRTTWRFKRKPGTVLRNVFRNLFRALGRIFLKIWWPLSIPLVPIGGKSAAQEKRGVSQDA